MNQTTVYGGVGSNRLTVGGALSQSSVYGGSGNDTLTVNTGTTDSSSNSVVQAGAGTDSLVLAGTLTGASVFGGASAFDTSDGGDTLNIRGALSSSVRAYAAGADSILASSTGTITSSTISAGTGNDFSSLALCFASRIDAGAVMTPLPSRLMSPLEQLSPLVLATTAWASRQLFLPPPSMVVLEVIATSPTAYNCSQPEVVLSTTTQVVLTL